MQRRSRFSMVLGLVGFVASGCGSDDDSKPSDCSVDAQTGCDDGQVCENVQDGEPACFAPLVVRGRVVESSNARVGIEGAIVAARDINGALVSRGTATSAADGSYELSVPVTRQSDGSPVESELTLRADANGHMTFPSGLRVAIPVDSSAPVERDGRWVIQNASTDVGLDRLADATGRGTVRGFVRADRAAGTLVVAGGQSGLADQNGAFTIFNVPSGDVEVQGYKAGLALERATAQVATGKAIEGVELRASSARLGSVTGDVSFVNAGAQETSVVLVVESTFNAALARGEVPVGLRLFPVNGRFSFTGVPAGDYVVLAAFENDTLVRDPDTSIGGTAIQRASVAGDDVALAGFKITGALDVFGPGAAGPEPVSGTPVFRWADDSSEDGYEVTVYDTFGATVYHEPNVPRVTGSSEVRLEYAGPALAPGYYQFRAVSYHLGKGGDGDRTNISATEDLKGVFIVP